MKLSEAIRLGAMIRPQGFHGLFGEGKSCAMGAALEAVGFPYEDIPSNQLCEGMKLFSGHSHTRWCPVCRESPQTTAPLYRVVEHLNDTHRWSREQIADWVEQVEQEVEPKPAEYVAACHVEGTTLVCDLGQPV